MGRTAKAWTVVVSRPRVLSVHSGFMTILLRFLALCVWALLPVRASAEIAWKERTLRLEPSLGAQQASGVFEFTNTGTTPVRIVEVRSGCGCTVAAVDKQVVQPGEKGTVQAVYHVARRTGRQTVSVTVLTEEPEAWTHELALEVQIGAFAQLTPRLLYWRVGDALEGRVLQVDLAEGFEFVGAASESADFKVEVVGKTAKTVQLKVIPRDTWAKRTGTIRVTVAQPGQPAAVASAMVRVL